MSIWRSSYSDPDSGAAYQRRHHPCRVKPPGLSVKLERDKRYVSLFGRSRARQDVRDSAATRVSCMPRYVCLALWSSRRARYKGHPDGSYRWRQADRHQRPGEMDAGVLASRIRNDEWPLRLSGAFAGRKSARSSGGGSSCTEVAELFGLVAIRDSTIGEYARDVRPGIWRRYLVLWLDALRPSRDSYTPLPVPELSPDEMATVMRNSPFGRHGTGNKQPAIKPRPKPPTARENTQESY